MKRTTLAVATFVLILSAAISCSDSVNPGTDEIYRASKAARDISHTYLSNPALYQHHYHDQPIKIYGRIDHIPTTTEVEIASYATMWRYRFRCINLKSAEVATLRQNQKVTTSGIIDIHNNWVAHINECEINAEP